MTVFTANTPTKDKNNKMSATSSLPSHFDDSPVLQVDLSNVMEEDDSHQDRDISYASPIPGHDHVTANETAYDLGAPPDTGGMRGNAFAHIESVQVIRRKKKKKGQRVANEDKFEKKFLLHPMTILFPESKFIPYDGLEFRLHALMSVCLSRKWHTFGIHANNSLTNAVCLHITELKL